MRSKMGLVSGIALILVGIAYVPISQLIIIPRYFQGFTCAYPPFGATDGGGFWECPPVWFDFLLAIIIPAVIVTTGLVLAIYCHKQPKNLKNANSIEVTKNTVLGNK